MFGGTTTRRVWNWGDAAYRPTGDGNIGWVRSGAVSVEGADQARGVGDAVAGFAQGAIASSEGPHPDVAYSWYVNFLKRIRDTAHPVLGPHVASCELLVGVALIVDAFVGIASFFGATLNFSFVLALTRHDRAHRIWRARRSLRRRDDTAGTSRERPSASVVGGVGVAHGVRAVGRTRIEAQRSAPVAARSSEPET